MPIVIGEIVRYRQEFLSPHGGINYPFSDIADVCGVITEITHDGAVARIEWDDGCMSAARLKNIERADAKPTATTAGEYKQIDLSRKVERAFALIDMLIDKGFLPKDVGISDVGEGVEKEIVYEHDNSRAHNHNAIC